MKIAITNWTSRQVGGAETYIAAVAEGLTALGHAVGFFAETDHPPDRPPIRLPAGAPAWAAARDGLDPAAAGLRAWGPDVILANGFGDAAVEREVHRLAPVAFVAHNYYGACVSGHKTTSLPVIRPCHRAFGPACLVRYFPLGCGGRSPVTMWRQYRTQRRRQRLVRGYDRVIVLSEHMRAEFVRNGVAPDRVARLAPGLPDDGPPPAAAPPAPPWRLVTAGRFDELKGGRVLLRAAPLIRRRIGQPVALTLIGDGPDRPAWERLASAARAADVAVEFTGWLPRPEVTARVAAAHLLVVPSLWPEPFGLTGVEAGRVGVPAVAFDVGGIRDWLTDGVNGVLAPGDPATPGGLADAVVRAIADPARYAALRAGAVTAAGRFALDRHVKELEQVLGAVCRAGGESEHMPGERPA